MATDLTPTSISVPASVTAGASFTATWAISNVGSTAANSTSTTVVRINQSSTSASPLVNLASISTPAVGGFGSVSQSATLSAPTAPGIYYVWVIADNGNQVNQGGATANDLQHSSSFTVAAVNTNPSISIIAASSYAAGTVLTGSQLFSVSDPQGASDINHITIYDANLTGGAIWKFNNSVITPTGTGYQVSYANRDLLTFTVGSGSDDFQAEAFDNAGHVSNTATGSIAGTSVNPSISIIAASSYAAGTVLTGSQLFSVSDPQGASDISPALFHHCR